MVSTEWSHITTETLTLLRIKFSSRIVFQKGDIDSPLKARDLTPLDFFMGLFEMKGLCQQTSYDSELKEVRREFELNIIIFVLFRKQVQALKLDHCIQGDLSARLSPVRARTVAIRNNNYRRCPTMAKSKKKSLAKEAIPKTHRNELINGGSGRFRRHHYREWDLIFAPDERRSGFLLQESEEF